MTVTSRQIRLAKRPEGLPDISTWELTTEELPDPGPGQILVAVDHISIDPAMRGWLNNTRSYVPPVGIGEVMRAIGTGTVIASQSPERPVGSHVRGLLGVADHAIIDAAATDPIDLDIAAEQTWLGALGMPGMTAYFGLFDVGRLRDGDTVVVSGAAGAVGSVVGQLAKIRGCRVIGIAGGPDKCAWLKEIGFDAAIDYRQGDVTAKLRELIPDGLDVYFDNVGGEILDAALANLRRGARIVLCGAISSYNAENLPPGPQRYLALLVYRASMTGFLVFDYADRFPEGVAAIAELIASGALVARETVVGGGIEGFPEALLGIYQGINTGKLVLTVP